MMKFDVVSDLHVTHNRPWEDHPAYDGVSSIYPWHLEKKSDVLVIVGDCSNDAFTSLAVVDEATRFYDHVIFTDGNHEHYDGYRDSAVTVGHNTALFRDYAAKTDGVTYLDGDTWVEIGNTMFIGANGWYDWTAHSWTSRDQQHQMWKNESNDSKCIRYDRGGYPDKLATKQAEQLRERVESAQSRSEIEHIVVATHTIPHRKGMVPDNHEWGHLNGSYFNAMMGQVWIADKSKKIKAWLFGHTHYNYDFDAEGVRFVNNSRGYYQPKLKPEFEGLKQIDLGVLPARSAFGDIEVD
jgi:hypothetical protein